MKVGALIRSLHTFPLDADVTLDIDDGLEGNFMPIKAVREVTTVMGSFVVLDADVEHTFKGNSHVTHSP